MRPLIYFALYVTPLAKRSNIYGTRLVHVPTPYFAVFFNGAEDRPERETMKLSAAFSKPTDEPELELICTVYNINPGKDSRLLGRCRVLEEYTEFVETVRRYEREGEEEPIDKAIEHCIRNHILEKYLKEHRAEVKRNMTIDMSFERREEFIREEGREEGRVSLIQKKVKKSKALDTIADELETTADEIRPLYDAVIGHPDVTNPKKILELL
ncbi:MAG: hypothetical protein K6G58_02575 [Lachnospiraceae bacterium]|nr:hypothetical protein [Lachnospiraceae bacterium]